MKSKLDPYDLAFQELLHEGKSKVSGVACIFVWLHINFPIIVLCSIHFEKCM